VPVWNARLASDEGERPQGNELLLDLEATRTKVLSAVVLECLDRRSLRSFLDRAYTGDRDTADTFAVSTVGPSVHLRFESEPPAEWRVHYLAGLSSRSLQAGEWLVSDANEFGHLCLATVPHGEARHRLASDLPQGRAVTETDLLELLWRICPEPLRRRLDLSAIERAGSMAFGVRQELQVEAGRAHPVTVVTLPCQPSTSVSELRFWLDRMEQEALEHCQFGESLRLELAPSQGEPK
jgi:hypothetical protein